MKTGVYTPPDLGNHQCMTLPGPFIFGSLNAVLKSQKPLRLGHKVFFLQINVVFEFGIQLITDFKEP